MSKIYIYIYIYITSKSALRTTASKKAPRRLGHFFKALLNYFWLYIYYSGLDGYIYVQMAHSISLFNFCLSQNRRRIIKINVVDIVKVVPWQGTRATKFPNSRTPIPPRKFISGLPPGPPVLALFGTPICPTTLVGTFPILVAPPPLVDAPSPQVLYDFRV